MRKLFIIFIVLGAAVTTSFAQCITQTGSSTCLGGAKSYQKGSTVSFSHTESILGQGYWTVQNGTPTSCNGCNSINVTWSSTASSGLLTLKHISGTTLDVLSVTLFSPIPAPKAPTVSDITVCGANSSVTFNASPGSGETTSISGYKWYRPNGTYITQTSGSYTTNPLDYSSSSGGTYQVSAVNSTGEGPKSNATVTLHAEPGLPTAPNKSRCGNGTVNLTASLSGYTTFRWYNQDTGGSVWKTGSSVTSHSLTSDRDYWVSAVSSQGCEGARRKMTVTVEQPAVSGISKTQSNSCGSTASGTLTLDSHTAGVFDRWETYNGSSWVKFGSLTFPPTTINYSGQPDGKRFRARISQSTCGYTYSNEEVITLVTSSDGGDAASNDTNVCANQAITLSVSGHTGSVVRWEKRIVGFSWETIASSAQSSIPFTMGSQPMEFQAVVQNGSCSSDTSTPVVVNIDSPLPPTAPDTARCGDGTVTLTASGAVSYNWWTVATGGTVWQTGSQVTTPVLTADTDYWVSGISAEGCESNRTKVEVTIQQPANGSIEKSQNNSCGTATSGQLTFTGDVTALNEWQIYQGGQWVKLGTHNFPPTTINYSLKPNGTQFRARMVQTVCDTSYTNIEKVLLASSSVGGTAASDDVDVCPDQDISLSVYDEVGSVVRWEKRIPGFPWDPIPNSDVSLFTYSMGAQPMEFRAIIQSGTCSTATSDFVTVNINSPMQTFDLLQDTSIYVGYDTVSIQLTGSVIGVSYQLFKDGAVFGAPKNGTGSALTWTPITATGVYSVTGELDQCYQQMNNEVVISANALPVATLLVDTLVVSIGRNDPVILNDFIDIPGTWTGNGVNINQFDAKTAGVGTHTMSYSKSYNFGYIINKTLVIIVENRMNSVQVYTARYKETSTSVDLDPIGPDSVALEVNYMDGIGRPVQRLLANASTNKSDLVVPIDYDELGRQAKGYLVYPTSERPRDFKMNAITSADSYYEQEYGTNPSAFSEATFEENPLSRVKEQAAPGADWNLSSGKTIKLTYETNLAADSVRVWDIVSDAPTSGGYYAEGELFKNSTTDEDGNTTIEFKNKRDQVVLKRSEVNASSFADTYYVYDIYDVLRVVLQPELSDLAPASGSWAPTTTQLASLAFLYEYDGKNRMIAKKVPGADSVLMVYDQWDRLVLTQDGNQRTPDQSNEVEWLFTKYDQLNRPIFTGILKVAGTVSVSTIRSDVLANGNRGESFSSGAIEPQYTDNTYPTASDGNGREYLTITYYDDYAFQSQWVEDLSYQVTQTEEITANDIPGATLLQSDYDLTPADSTKKFMYKPDVAVRVTAGVALKPGARLASNIVVNMVDYEKWNFVHGQVTGTMTKTGDGNWIKSVSYYDDRYRSIQVQSTNHLGGKDVVTNYYDFVDNVTKTVSTHSNGADTTTIARRFEYDHANRLLKIYHQVNNESEVLLAASVYNERGELIEKDLHGGEQSMDYAYNIRGWLTSINDPGLNGGDGDLFGMELLYNSIDPNLGNTSLFNGNISAMKWSHHNTDGGTIDSLAYTYAYDKLNRLTTANHFENNTGTNKFGVSGLDYDLNGNIEALKRRSTSTSAYMDDLSYSYDGNRLLSVSDAATDTLGFHDRNTVGNDYTYDANGNMIEDLNKNIDSIYYNHLNLPVIVDFDTAGDSITYLYDAAGIKLQQTVYDGGVKAKTTDYVGEFIYETDTSGTRRLQLIQHEEGRLTPLPGGAGGGFDYQYHLKDHLGNTRLTFSTTSENYTIVETFETGEENGFEDLHRFTSSNANTTAGGNEVERLQSDQTGALVFISTNQGDTVNLSVQANYEGTPSGNTFLQTGYNALFTSFDNAFGGAEGVSATSTEFNDALSGANMAGKGNTSTAPRAFLNYIFFDKDMNYVRAGFQQITTSAQGIGVHEQLFINDIIAEQEGYVLGYLSNENQEAIDVHFDDFTVYHGKTNVVQADDYYPFGLTFNGYQRTASTVNRFKYNGFEELKEWGVYDYLARYYDPAIGRFLMVDPAAEFMRRHSPYNYAFDNPIRYIDPDGMMPTDQVEGNSPCDQGDCPEETTTTETETKKFTDIEVEDNDGNKTTVTVTFQDTSDGESSDNEVDAGLVDAVEGAVKEAHKNSPITSIVITSTTNGTHGTSEDDGGTSRHYSSNGAKAVDIGTVNGANVSENPSEAVKALQNAFENQDGRRENFGPHIMKKSGSEYIHDGLSESKKAARTVVKNAHKTHLHWSID